MATYLISILAALAIVMIIILLGLILTQIFINRANKTQTQLSEQSQGVFVDIDNLLSTEQQPSIAVISNDIMEDTPHSYRHLIKKTLSAIDQDTQIDRINNKNIHLTKPTKTNLVNPITDKITLDY